AQDAHKSSDHIVQLRTFAAEPTPCRLGSASPDRLRLCHSFYGRTTRSGNEIVTMQIPRISPVTAPAFCIQLTDLAEIARSRNGARALAGSARSRAAPRSPLRVGPVQPGQRPAAGGQPGAHPGEVGRRRYHAVAGRPRLVDDLAGV